MNIKVKRDYWRMDELKARWKVSVHDMARLVMTKAINPCVMLDCELQPVDMVDGLAVPKNGLERVSKWLYPVFPVQVLPFDCEYTILCDMVRHDPEANYYLLPGPLRLSAFISDACLMDDDLKEAEEELRGEIDPDLMHGKERASLHRLLIVAVTEAFGYDPTSARSHVVTDLVRASEALQIPVAYGTAKKYLHQAWETSKPVREAEAA